jgi:4-hydroxy-tetrahydrodipicolinate reductase
MCLTIYIHGASGRVGSRISYLIDKDTAFKQTEVLAECDAVIDFSAPSALISLLSLVKEHKKPLIIGTTGYSQDDRDLIKKAAAAVPILHAPNFSLGMSIYMEAAALISKKFSSTANIIEIHHEQKKDKPSGTALELAALLKSENSIHSIRAGDEIGLHTILFTGKHENIEMRHQATSRDVFAHGALMAATFLVSKSPGYYSLKDLFI